MPKTQTEEEYRARFRKLNYFLLHFFIISCSLFLVRYLTCRRYRYGRQKERALVKTGARQGVFQNI
jgi:hypothetical protein